jgi:hypothetical protein
MSPSQRLVQLRNEARYHRQRYDLYRASLYAGRPTTPARLRELERAFEAAESRLRQAQRQHPGNP